MSNPVARFEFVVQCIFRQQSRCPHCASGSTIVVARKHVITRVRECVDCGLYFTDPLYRPILAQSLYEKLYSAEGSTTRLPGAAELQKLVCTEFAHSDKNFASTILALRSITPSGRLLEIGSSWGYFLWQWNRAGGSAVGMEISDYRRSFGLTHLGVEIVKDFDCLNSTCFDLVYTAHTLEHFTDLSRVFADIYEHLSPGGAVLIEVPNFAFRQKGDKVLAIIGAVHPLGFSERFFKKVLPRYGFISIEFFDSYCKIPHEPGVSQKLESPNIICLARKRK